jgi:CBS domain-containing protein
MKVREVMTPNPVTVDAEAPIMRAAEAMRQNDIGDVVVRKNGKLCGIVTDRDIVVRALAASKDPDNTKLESICSQELVTVSPDHETSEAVKLMKERAIRFVVHNGMYLGLYRWATWPHGRAFGAGQDRSAPANSRLLPAP